MKNKRINKTKKQLTVTELLGVAVISSSILFIKQINHVEADAIKDIKLEDTNNLNSSSLTKKQDINKYQNKINIQKTTTQYSNPKMLISSHDKNYVNFQSKKTLTNFANNITTSSKPSYVSYNSSSTLKNNNQSSDKTTTFSYVNNQYSQINNKSTYSSNSIKSQTNLLNNQSINNNDSSNDLSFQQAIQSAPISISRKQHLELHNVKKYPPFAKIAFTNNHIVIWSLNHPIINRIPNDNNMPSVTVVTVYDNNQKKLFTEYIHGSHENIQKPGYYNSFNLDIGDTIAINYNNQQALNMYTKSNDKLEYNKETINNQINSQQVTLNGKFINIKQHPIMSSVNFKVTSNGIKEIVPQDRIINITNSNNQIVGKMIISYGTNKLIINGNTTPLTTPLGINILNQDDKLIYQCKLGNGSIVNQNMILPMNSTIQLSNVNINNVKINNDNGNLVNNNLLNNGNVLLAIQGNEIAKGFIPNINDLSAYKYILNQKLGTTNIEKLKNNNPVFMQWLSSNAIALQDYLSGGYASNKLEIHMDSYHFNNKLNSNDEYQALSILNNIWSKYPSSHQGMGLRFAIAIALEFANGINAWIQKTNIDPIQRYVEFEQAYNQKILMPDIDQYSIKELRNIVNCQVTNQDLLYLWNTIPVKYSYLYSRDYITDGFSLVKYNESSPYGSVFSNHFYGPNATIASVIQLGGVCGAESTFSAILAAAFGVPAFPIGQPGHCAYIYMTPQHQWKLGYNIDPWNETSGYATFLPLVFNGAITGSNQAATLHALANTYRAQELVNITAEQLNLWQNGVIAMPLTNNKTQLNQALDLVKAAIQITPHNILAWETYIAIADKLSQTQGLSDQIKQTFATTNDINNQTIITLLNNEISNSNNPFQAANHELNTIIQEAQSYINIQNNNVIPLLSKNSFNDLITVVTNSTNVLNNPNSSMDEYNNSIISINQAIMALQLAKIPNYSNNTLATNNLNQEIQIAQQFINNNITSSINLTNLEQCISKSQNILNNDYNNTSRINAQAKVLLRALQIAILNKDNLVINV